jgi:hypothetical protein
MNEGIGDYRQSGLQKEDECQYRQAAPQIIGSFSQGCTLLLNLSSGTLSPRLCVLGAALRIILRDKYNGWGSQTRFIFKFFYKLRSPESNKRAVSLPGLLRHYHS